MGVRSKAACIRIITNTSKRKQITFARIIVPVHAINYMYFFVLLYVNGNAKNVVFVVKRFAVRNAYIRPGALRTLKIKQYTVRKGDFPLHNEIDLLDMHQKLNNAESIIITKFIFKL